MNWCEVCVAAALLVLGGAWAARRSGVYHEGSRTFLWPDDNAFQFGYSVLLQTTTPPRLVVGAPSSTNVNIKPHAGAGEVYFCILNLPSEASNFTCHPDINNGKGMNWCEVCVAAALLVLGGAWAARRSGVYHEGSRTFLWPDDNAFQFGYSVLLQTTTPPRLVVGAPSSTNINIKPHAGAGEVYFCILNLPSEASNITCHPDINSGKEAEKQYNSKNSNFTPYVGAMRLGTTLIDTQHGSLLACAPTWANDDRNVRAPNGMCHVISPNDHQTLFPLLNTERQMFHDLRYFEQGQAGISAASAPTAANSTAADSEEESHLLLGAPGLTEWTGGVVTYKIFGGGRNSKEATFKLLPTVNLHYTKSVHQDSYFGYSVALGVFDNSGATLGVAGAPRSGKAYGEVYVFSLGGEESDPLDVRARLTGSQYGEYFGASLLVADVNDDGRADLLVGAPQRSEPSTENNCCYDQGAVYVYINKENGSRFTLELATVLRGSGASGAKFGLAMAALGDVDGDGYTDVAIGAPWESYDDGGDSSGAVYVYRGGRLGLRPQHAQRIANMPGLSGFGFSVASGVDLDNNGCNELAVGSVVGGEYRSGLAAVFRCSPTLLVNGSIELVGVPAVVLRAGVAAVPRNLTSLTARFCAHTQHNSHWPNAKRDINATVTIHQHITSFQLSAMPGVENCSSITVNVDASWNQITLKLNLEAVIDISREESTFDPLYAILDSDSELNSTTEVRFVADCGEDMVCDADIRMKMTSLSSSLYIPGVDQFLGVAVIVQNHGDPAYGRACVRISSPSALLRVPADCTLQEHELTCKLSEPFLRNAVADWTVVLQTEKNLTDRDVVFMSTLYTECEGNPTSQQNLTIRVERRADITVIGSCKPNSTITVSRKSPIEFAHSFEVTNHGPSDWSDLIVRFTLSPKVTLLESAVDCVPAPPTLHQCAWALGKGEKRTAFLRLLLNVTDDEFQQLQERETLNITTRAEVIYGKINKWSEASTRLVLEPPPPPPDAKLIVLAVLAGLLLVATIVFVLYKTGFFKRSKKQELVNLKKDVDGPDTEAPTTAGAPSTDNLLEEDL